MSDENVIYTDDQGTERNNDDNVDNLPSKPKKFNKVWFFILVLVFALIMGMVGTIGTLLILTDNPQWASKLGMDKLSIPITKSEKILLEESSKVIEAAEKISPAVVSIISKSQAVNIFGQVIEQEAGGTGFIITSDGMIVTNKHVASDMDGQYLVYTSDGKEYEARVLAQDPYYDLAVLKIDATGLPTAELGDSGNLKIGQWVVAVGNALGEFQNTVTVGVVSALERSVTASDGMNMESLEGLIQTDAAINSGNSGGPLVNLSGQVVGINTAIASGAQNIGFAIPIDSVKTAIESIQKTGTIKRPMLGVRYLTINKEISKANELQYDYGAWILPGENRGIVAVIPGSPADKAGLVENDIILEIDNQRIDEKNSLARILSKYNVGDEVSLKYSHKGEEKEIIVKLDEAK